MIGSDIISEIRTRLPALLMSLIFCSVGFFLFLNMLYDERGLMTLVNLNSRLEDSRQELESIRAERQMLEHKVSMLRSGSLDLDLIDEQARKTLGYTKPGELVIMVPQVNKAR